MTSDGRTKEAVERRGLGKSAVLLAAALLLIDTALAVAWLPRSNEGLAQEDTGDRSAVAASRAEDETRNREFPIPELTLELRVEGADTARFAAAEGDLLTYRDRGQGLSVGVVLKNVDRERGAVTLEVLDYETDSPGEVRCGHTTMPLGTVGFRCGGVDLRVETIGFDEYWSCQGSVEEGRTRERCQADCGSTIASGPRVQLFCAKCCAR